MWMRFVDETLIISWNDGLVRRLISSYTSGRGQFRHVIVNRLKSRTNIPGTCIRHICCDTALWCGFAVDLSTIEIGKDLSRCMQYGKSEIR